MHTTVPVTCDGENYAAALRFTPDGKYVVVSNRGYDALSTFDFDLESGTLKPVAHSILPGNWPRDFIFLPGSDFAVVAMERSNTLLSARYDASTGTFTALNSLGGFNRPVTLLPEQALQTESRIR